MKYGKAINFYNDGSQVMYVEKKVKMSDEIAVFIDTPLVSEFSERYKEINEKGYVPLVGGVSKFLQNVLNGLKIPLVNQLLLIIYDSIPTGTIEADYTDITEEMIKYGDGFGVKMSMGFHVAGQCMQSIYETYFYKNDEKMKLGNLYQLLNEVEASRNVYFAIIGNRKIDLLPLTGGETPVTYGYLIPYLTANSSLNHVVTCNGVYTNAPNLQQYKPFAEVTGDGWQSNTVNTGWIAIQLPVAKQVTKIYTGISAVDSYFSAWVNNMPKNWKFQGSNDGTTWTDLLVVTNDPARTDRTFKEYVLTSPGIYSRYKFDITATVGLNGQTAIGKILFYGIV